MASPLSPLGIVATQSTDFVATVLETLEQRRTVVLLRDLDDDERKAMANVDEVVTPGDGTGWAQWSYTPNHSRETAQFLFTSGTEGRPKGVELPHGALADVVERLNNLMGVTSEIREYVGIPVYHSFGFGRCRCVAAAGGRAFLPANGFDPLEVAEMLRRGEINAISAVPSLWRVLLDAAPMFAGITEAVRWIEIGSQYMSRPEKEALRDLFPNANIVMHYGLTEASRSTFLEIHRTNGDALESVGRGFGDVEIGLTDDGRIKVRGPHVATRIWIDGVSRSAVDADGWFETQDLGSIREGYVFFEGRADDLINCGGIKLSPEVLEANVRAQLGAGARFAISRKPDPVRGDGVLVSVPSSSELDAERLRAAVEDAARSHGVNARGAISTMLVDELPRTASGKVQRRKLTAAWVEANPVVQTPVAVAPDVATSGVATNPEQMQVELLGIWKEALGVEDIGVDESFYDLGGDSLTALNVILRMGRAGIDPAICRSIFQGATIRQLVEASAAGDASPGELVPEVRSGGLNRDYANNIMVNAVRGLLIIFVVCGHWSPAVLSRLPESWGVFVRMLSPILSYGTPGFAITFGVGLGYLQLPIFERNPERVRRSMRSGVMLVGAGTVLVGLLASAAEFFIKGQPFSTHVFFVSFFSPLLFYTLAVATIPAWFSLTTRLAEDSRARIRLLLGLASMSAAVQAALDVVLADVKVTGFLQLVRLMLEAKFAYFDMMTLVFVGLAIGTYIKAHGEEEGVPRAMARGGLVVAVVALVLGYMTGGIVELTYWPSKNDLSKWVFYVGLVMLTISALMVATRRFERLPPRGRWLLKLVATLGQLSLPFYILSALPIPLKSVFEQLGLPGPVALLVSLGLFFGGSYVLVRRVYALIHD